MKFLSLENKGQLEEISQEKTPQIIFKHNTTCPISKSVLRSLKEDDNVLPPDTPFYQLDLLNHRDISDAIAEKFSVTHESPQLLLIRDGKCSYHQSLYSITPEETAGEIAKIS